MGLTGGILATGNYPGKARTRRRSAAGSRTRSCGCFPAGTAWPLHAIYGETSGRKVAARRVRAGAFFALDRLGPAGRRWVWISIRPFSRMPTRPTDSRWPTGTRASASSGSAMASPAARSARRLDGRWERPASPTSGFRTATRTRRPIACAARAAARIVGRDFRRADRSASSSRCGREQAVRHRLGKLRRRLARVLSRLCDPERSVLLTLDAGHFHPTEGIADKISSVLLYVPEILLHVSRASAGTATTW